VDCPGMLSLKSRATGTADDDIEFGKESAHGSTRG
jgi:hypothetical protein